MNISSALLTRDKAAAGPAGRQFVEPSTQARDFASLPVSLGVKGVVAAIRAHLSGAIQIAVRAPDSPDPQVRPVRAEGARLLDPARPLLSGAADQGVRA